MKQGTLIVAFAIFVVVLASAMTAHAVPVKFVFRSTVTTDTSLPVQIPGVSRGDILTITLVADNGSDSLASQTWHASDLISGRLTVGSYWQSYTDGWFNSPTDVIFQTGPTGAMVFAGFFGTNPSVNHRDSYGTGGFIQLSGNAFIDYNSRVAYQTDNLSPSPQNPGLWTVQASMVTLNFRGGNLKVVGEYINANRVTTPIFSPLFENGKTVSITIAYDISQPDVNPDGNTGTYRIGSFSATIPELALSASRSSSSMQISAFNNTSNPDDQFFAYVNGADSFSSNVGLPNPVAFSAGFLGDTSMLANDLLPTDNLNWISGDLSFDFTDGDGTVRQVLLAYTPAPIPNPVVVFTGTEDYAVNENFYTRYDMSVTNWQLYPAELFKPGPYKCGLNNNASRTWVDIYDQSGVRIYGFCGFESPYGMTNIWFGIPQTPPAPSGVYVVVRDNLTGNTYRSALIAIGETQPSVYYPPVSLPLDPGGSGGTGEVYQLYEFDGTTFNFGVKYNADPDLDPGISLVVQPILISQDDLAERVDGSAFEGATLVPYDGAEGKGVLFRVTCEDTAHVPVECPAPVGTYDVKSAWYPPTADQTVVAPAFLKAPIGTNEWEDVLLSYYEDKIDGTAVARPCCRYSDFLFVDMVGVSGMGTPLPTISINSPVANGEYALHSLFEADYTCTAADGTSLESCLGARPSGQLIDTSSVGTKTFEVTATVSSSSRTVSYTRLVSYTVVSDNVCLLYDPYRSVKKGAAYPIKLQICDDSGNNLSAFDTVLHADPELVQKDSVADGPLVNSGNANPDNDFRFDSTLGVGGGYIYNLKTTGLSSGTWILYFTIEGDPVKHSTLFNVR